VCNGFTCSTFAFLRLWLALFFYSYLCPSFIIHTIYAEPIFSTSLPWFLMPLHSWCVISQERKSGWDFQSINSWLPEREREWKCPVTFQFYIFLLKGRASVPRNHVKKDAKERNFSSWTIKLNNQQKNISKIFSILSQRTRDWITAFFFLSWWWNFANLTHVKNVRRNSLY